MTSYALSGVRYTADGLLIHRVRLHEVRAGWVGPPLEIGRDQLLGALESGRTIGLIIPDPSGRYIHNGTVRAIAIKGRPYLRSADLPAPADDLVGLPVF